MNEYYKNKFSFIVITNASKPLITKKALTSIVNQIKNTHHELILVGKVSFFKNISPLIKLVSAINLANQGQISGMRNLGVSKSQGDIIINFDDDIIITNNFVQNLEISIRNNDWDVFNTKMLLPNGGRWWDRAVYTNGKHLIKDYNYIGENLFYVGSLLIRKRELALKIPWNENHLYYDPNKENEDIVMSWELLNNNYKINIDTNLKVYHADFSYLSIINGYGNQVVIHKNHYHPSHKIISSKTEQLEFNNLFKSL